MGPVSPSYSKALGVSILTDAQNAEQSKAFYKGLGLIKTVDGKLYNPKLSFFVKLINLKEIPVTSRLSASGEAGKSFHPFYVFHIDPGSGYSLENLKRYLIFKGITFQATNNNSGKMTSIEIKDLENNIISFEKSNRSVSAKSLAKFSTYFRKKDDLEKVDHLAIETKNIQEMINFYQDLGFVLVKTPDNVNGAWLYTFNSEGTKTGFGIHLMNRSAGGAPRPFDPKTINISHASFAFGKNFNTETAEGILNILKRSQDSILQKFKIDPVGTRIEQINRQEIQTLVLEQLLPIKQQILRLSKEDQKEAIRFSMQGASLEEITQFVEGKIS